MGRHRDGRRVARPRSKLYIHGGPTGTSLERSSCSVTTSSFHPSRARHGIASRSRYEAADRPTRLTERAQDVWLVRNSSDTVLPHDDHGRRTPARSGSFTPPRRPSSPISCTSCRQASRAVSRCPFPRWRNPDRRRCGPQPSWPRVLGDGVDVPRPPGGRPHRIDFLPNAELRAASRP